MAQSLVDPGPGRGLGCPEGLILGIPPFYVL